MPVASVGLIYRLLFSLVSSTREWDSLVHVTPIRTSEFGGLPHPYGLEQPTQPVLHISTGPTKTTVYLTHSNKMEKSTSQKQDLNPLERTKEEDQKTASR